MNRSSPLLLVLLAGAALAQAPAPDADERLLREHNIASDDAALLRFFRERTLDRNQVQRLKGLLVQLGSKSFTKRNQAATELVKAGMNAKALLVEVVQDPASGQEAARRAELCLRQIDDGKEVALAQAAARLLGARKPPEAAAVLIDYVPFAGDPQVLDAVQDALNVVAVRNGKADVKVLQASRGPHLAQRAAAGVALVRSGGTGQKSAMAHLLQDASPRVRLPVALALVEAKDKDSVPIVIERIADAPPDRLWQALELLERIAGDKGPTVYPSAKTSPAQVRDAWQKWWATSAATVDLTKLTDAPPYLGYKLITLQQPAKVVAGAVMAGGGKVVELRADGTVHWEIGNVNYPLDARVVGPNRVLVAEYLGRRVTERDFKGEILWEKPIDMPIACQRGVDGTTFIATRRQLIIVDAEKKEVFSHFCTGGSISAAHRTRDGHMVLALSTGQCHWLDPQGKEIKSFPIGYMYPMGGNLEVLPNRHVLVPLSRDGKLAEFDADGKMVWHAAIQSPVSVTRLPTGNLLVVTMQQRVVEIDRTGQTVWNWGAEGRAWRARGR